MTDARRKDARNKTHHPNTRNRTRRKGLVERAAETVETVHRRVAGLPLDLLEHIDRLEKPVARVRKLQDRSITATYEMLRGLNREVAKLLREPSHKSPKRSKAHTVHHTKRGVEAAHPPTAAAAT